VRAFVALEIPQAVRDEIARRVGRWKASTPPARWVRQEAWHVTLLFLGEVPEAQTEDLRALLAPAFRRRRTFELQVVGAGGVLMGCWCAMSRPLARSARLSPRARRRGAGAWDLWSGLWEQGQLSAGDRRSWVQP
jgi:hypothetical protein